MRSLRSWLDEYGESHTNETNKTIHWICVPAIFFSIFGLLYSIKLPMEIIPGMQLNVAVIVFALVLIYYFRLSASLGLGMLVFMVLCFFICSLVEGLEGIPLWLFCLIIFVAAWVGQFYGHSVEGKKPSFLKDFLFLLIGPLWLLSFVYQRLGIRY